MIALTIYAKAGLVRPRTCSCKAKATNFGLKAKARTNITEKNVPVMEKICILHFAVVLCLFLCYYF